MFDLRTETYSCHSDLAQPVHLQVYSFILSIQLGRLALVDKVIDDTMSHLISIHFVPVRKILTTNQKYCKVGELKGR